MNRSSELETFFNATADALAAANLPDAARRVADRIVDAGRTPSDATFPEPCELPVCTYLEAAFDHARAHGSTAATLADALRALAPRLCWSRRPRGENDDAAFQSCHANAVVIGEHGLEAREDILIGVSLLAPDTRYPDHRHPPEEIYTVLSPGEWKHNDGPWHTPGVGGFVHNPPNIIHAMRSGDSPLLAVWCLMIEASP